MQISLLLLSFKKRLRSANFKQGWGVRILLGFLTVYFGAIFGFMGFLLPEILEEVFPTSESVLSSFHSLILHYMLADLVLRFFLQDLNMLEIRHYLLTPIRKYKIVHHVLTISVFSFFNLIPLFFILPFAVRETASSLGPASASIWAISLIALFTFNHFLAIFLKRVVAVKRSVFLAAVGLVAVLYVGDALGWFSLRDWSTTLFQFTGSLWMLAIALLALGLMYTLNFRFLRSNLQLDKWTSRKKSGSGIGEIAFLENRGALAMLIANEIKLILRNKRTRTIAFMSLFFVAYGLLFYLNTEAYPGMGWKIFAGIFMTGIFMINYGQFAIAWESAYFDGILSRAFDLKLFIEAKFLLMALSCIAPYLLSLFYGFIAWEALLINTACFIFNVGFNSFILLFAATYQKKRIDLSKSSMFNYQGTSAVQFVVALPLLLIPIFIWMSFNVFGLPYYGLAALALIGGISLLFRKQWIKGIVENLYEKKYRMAEGFRQ